MSVRFLCVRGKEKMVHCNGIYINLTLIHMNANSCVCSVPFQSLPWVFCSSVCFWEPSFVKGCGPGYPHRDRHISLRLSITMNDQSCIMFSSIHRDRKSCSGVCVCACVCVCVCVCVCFPSTVSQSCTH